MSLFVVLIIAAAIAVVVIAVWFLNRFYQKASAETALVRTGAGGRVVVVDGGCLVLPLAHKLQKVSLKAIPVRIALTGNRSVITADRLRADLEMEFLTRVQATPQGVAIAAQSLGSRGVRNDEPVDFIHAHLADAIQSVAASKTLDKLHEDRQAFVQQVHASLVDQLARLGLSLETSSLIHLDQTEFSALDQNNAFNAVGMRRLSEVIAENRRQQVETEVKADIAVRESQLQQAQRRLEIERQQTEYEQQCKSESKRLEALAQSQIAQDEALAAAQAKTAQITQDRETKAAEIERDRLLREREMTAILELETRKIDNAIALSDKQTEETAAQIIAEQARAGMVQAIESVQTQKDIAIAERAKELALLKAQQDAAVETEKTKTRVSTVVAMAQADADSKRKQSETEKLRLLAESEGRRALILAENETSDALMAMKLEMHRLDRLPEIATQMMKPVEKIDSIRINHIGGLGGLSGGGDAGSGSQSPISQAMESILGMAVQLPAMKSLGEEIGLGFDANLAGRVTDSANRSKSGFSNDKADDGQQDQSK